VDAPHPHQLTLRELITEWLVGGRITTLEHRLTRMETRMANQQADLDAVAQRLADLKDTLTAADAGIQAEIDALKSQNPSLDLSGLQAAVDGLSSQVDATAALVPAPPAA
jgi:uncharacterized coiled-coil protein SlyX